VVAIDYRSQGWDIVRYQGQSSFKRLRIRRNSIIEQVVDNLRNHEYTVVLGPRFHEKTRLLHDVEATVDNEPGMVATYVDLRQARTDTESSFYTSFAQLIANQLPYLPRTSLDEDIARTRDFQNFLSSCLDAGKGHLVLLIDHLQILPQDMIHSLLKALRAVYMERNAAHYRQLGVVITGSVSLAELSQGPSSPFNIARPVVLLPLTLEQSEALARETVNAYGKAISDHALEQILAWTAGDCYLLPYLCYIGQEIMAGYRRPLMTQTVVRQAVDHLWQSQDARWPIDEAIRTIEEDVDTLMDVLDILQKETLAPNQARQEYARTGTNRLQLSGAVKMTPAGYQFKNKIYQRAISERLTAARVGRVLRMAGRWRDAIEYLAPKLGQKPSAAERADLLEAIVQSIYAADTLSGAYAELVEGIHQGFDLRNIAIYCVDAAQSELRLVHSDGLAPDPQERIDLNEHRHMEVRTFHSAHYALRKDAHSRRLVAALVPERRPIGVVSISGYDIPDERWDIPADLMELLGFLRHAAGAIENVMMRSAFQEIGQAVLEVGGVNTSLHRVLTTVSNALGCDFGILYLLDKTGTSLAYTAGVGHSMSHIELEIRRDSLHPAVRALEQSNPMPVRATAELPPRIFLPLSAAGRELGALELGFQHIHQPQLNEEYRNLLRTFADQVAIAVHNMQLLSSTDEALQAQVKELEIARRELEIRSEQELTDVARALLHRLGNAAGDVPYHLKRVRTGLDDPAPTVLESLDHVEKRFHSLIDLRSPMKDLVELERIEHEPVDLVHVVNTAIERVMPVSNVTLHRDISLQPAWVLGKFELLVDAFQSIIENGCEAMSEGGRLAISVQQSEGTILVSISDTGVGIPDSVEPRIFEPGFSTKATAAGERGHGMFTCRAILRKHRSNIRYQTKVGTGTTFIVEIPSFNF
jgi:signal transduction histidine kinase